MMLGALAMSRQRGRPKGASDGEIRKRIVHAAADEFARAGYDGARIERVAQAAGCNRSLVYFYFRDKAGLFEAALDEAAEHREEQMAAQPSTLEEGLVYWFRRNFAEPRRIRLVMQEALAPPLPSGAPARRAAYLGKQLEVVRAFQSAGLLRRDLDSRHLLTIFLALTSFPASFPKVAAAALGAGSDEQLVEEWSACLAEVARLLAP
jgi:AcrR family transcriptional regulator